jgi:hypothetical protein
VALAVLLGVVPWGIGVRMSDWTQGRVVVAHSTCYPSTDGFWPMGAYGSFFLRLARSCERPIDHNQEVWEAWTSLDAGQLPPGRGAVISSGLVAYGRFAMSWHGREAVTNSAVADYILFDDRTVAKRQLGVDFADWHADDKVGKLLTKGQVRVVGRRFGRSVLLWTPEGEGAETDDRLSLRAALPTVYGGNDFRMERWGETQWKRDLLDGHRTVLAARSPEMLTGLAGLLGASPDVVECRSAYDPRPWHAAAVRPGQLRKLLEEESMEEADLWITCGMLPGFMDVRRYGK